MRAKDQTLDNILDENCTSNQFKSMGERKIAYFLENNNIKYRYESGVLIYQEENKPRIWYPDFTLPEFSTYIEYYGMVGNPDYDRGIKAKEKAYCDMGLSVIPVYPKMFNKNWQGYILNEIKRKVQRQYNKISSIYFKASNTPGYRF